METIEASLLNHRRALITYMSEWNKQQESILAKYADCIRREAGVRQDSFANAAKEPTDDSQTAKESIQGSHSAKDPVSDSSSSCSRKAETEGIRAFIPRDRALPEVVMEEPAESAQGIRGRVAMVVGSPKFSCCISVVILLNVLFMAIAADRTLEFAQSGQHSVEQFLVVGEILFLSIYVVELALKLFAFGWQFFGGPEWCWNIFDLVVVISAFFDLLSPYFMMGDAINMLRVNRPLKLLKMMRIVSLTRSLKELRLIISSILGCLKTMVWAIALLSMVLFTFALVFVQAVTDYVTSKHPSDWNPDLLLSWGSTAKSMNTLFQASTGGADWEGFAEPLWELGWVYYVAFMLYICFFLFIVTNILTALFVETALDSSMKDDSMAIREVLKHKMEYVRQIESLYRRLDADGSGKLTWDRLKTGLQSPDMLAFAATMDIEISDIDEFFRMISYDGRQDVDIESFVVGCMKLKGPAKNLDLVSLLHRAKHLEHTTTTSAQRVDDHLHEITRLLGRVMSEQEATRGVVSGLLSVVGVTSLDVTPQWRVYSMRIGVHSDGLSRISV